MNKLIITLAFFSFLFVSHSEARVSGGRSFGSRGSRMTAPRSYPSNSSRFNSNANSAPRNDAPAAAPYGGPQSAPQPAFGGGGFMRGMAGGLMGGMLGSLLFRNQGWGAEGGLGGLGGGGQGGAGIGFIEILLFAGAAFFLYRWVKQRNGTTFATASPQGYASPYQAPSTVDVTPVQNEREIASVLRQSDPNFELTEFKEARTDDFFKLQAALMSRELGPVRDKVTSEILSILQSDISTLKEAGKINRIENIAVREAEIVEAWVEGGRQYATLRLKASLLDYTVDDKTSAVLAGSTTEPIKFQEHWTFVCELGANQWKLSAIENNA